VDIAGLRVAARPFHALSAAAAAAVAAAAAAAAAAAVEPLPASLSLDARTEGGAAGEGDASTAAVWTSSSLRRPVGSVTSAAMMAAARVGVSCVGPRWGRV